ncbi:MAG TPA: DUF418 domain-containing protein [Polyangiaceae bacterium]|nr:DUF418 domain-containing protein [Polyangiaceae bacterium]
MNPDISMTTAVSAAEAHGISPVSRHARIDDIDVIRGVALFGVLMMNLAESYRLPHWGIKPDVDLGRLDHVVHGVEQVLLSAKAYTLFSVLFGVGLSIFLERADARAPRAMYLLTRRLLVLMAFGFMHAFFLFTGDILVSYALFGLLALLLIRQRSAVLWAAIGTCLLFATLVRSWPAVSSALSDRIPGHYEGALRAYGTGTYLEVVRFRVGEEFEVVTRFYGVAWAWELLNMLIGVLLWRSGIFHARAPDDHRRTLRWMAFGGILIGFSYALYETVRADFHPALPALPFGLPTLLHWSTTLLFALGYGAGLLLLLRRDAWRKRLSVFSPLGRMAFTNYLTQSLVFTSLFYGYGGSLLGRVGHAGAALMGIAFYILQGIASAIWLRRFSFGPLEWLWRSFTYGQWQPLRRPSPLPRRWSTNPCK